MRKVNSISLFQNITKMSSLIYLGNSYYSTQNLVVVVNAGKASVNSGETVLSPDPVTAGIGVQRTTGER